MMLSQSLCICIYKWGQWSGDPDSEFNPLIDLAFTLTMEELQFQTYGHKYSDRQEIQQLSK